MNDFDSIMAGANNTSASNNFNKDEWKKKKQEERKFAYDTMDKTAEEIVKDVEKFKSYLDVQGKFDKYSVGNALLITNQMPQATQLKEFSDWKDQGAYIKKNETSIIILEPGDQYTRADGSVATSYNPKKMFDISQTTAKPKIKTNSYDDSVKLAALLKELPVDIKVLDSMENTDKVANWNKEDNVLYVAKTEDTQKLFKELSTELAKIGIEESSNVHLDNFKSECTAYMLCKRYGVDVSKFNINHIPESLKNMSSSEIRNELTSMRSAMEDINSRMNQYFESITKAPKNKEHER